MKRKEFIVLAGSVLALSVMGLAGCGSNDSASSSATTESASADADTAAESSEASDDEITEITVVTAGTGEPYSLLHDDGTWTGIDAEIWAQIEERTGITVTVKQAAFDSLWGELDTERADVAANCFAVKAERVDKYNASIPYYGDAQCIIVNNDSDYQTVEDLTGTTVGCTNGQAAQTIIEELAEENDFEVKLYEDSTIGMSDLMLGRIEAYANTTTNVNSFTHNNEEADFRFFDEDLTANNVAYFFPKTERGEKVKAFVDEQLQAMLDDGTIAEITEKWMFADMTQLIQDDLIAG